MALSPLSTAVSHWAVLIQNCLITFTITHGQHHRKIKRGQGPVYISVTHFSINGRSVMITIIHMAQKILRRQCRFVVMNRGMTTSISLMENVTIIGTGMIITKMEVRITTIMMMAAIITTIMTTS